MIIKQNNRLVLGTAQIGMNYGIANKSGKPELQDALEIIQTAWKNGIIEFDTAQAYGDSEKVLGQVLRSLGICDQVRIISKFHPDIDHLDPNVLTSTLERTLENLGVSKLYGLMLHREELLNLWDSGLAEILNGFIRSGVVENIGVSIYSPKKAIQSLKIEKISFIQIPTNILDRRFEKAGVFALAEKNHKKVYIRSIFLQGLLLIEPDALPENMIFAKSVLDQFREFTDSYDFSPQELALGYVRERFAKAGIIFGVETRDQVMENIACWSIPVRKDIISQIKKRFDKIDERILNPALWPVKE